MTRRNGAQRTRAERRQARATHREARWTRPPPPKDWRYFVGGLGRILIATGLLMFGFVAYQLWGTGLEYAQAQDRLDRQLEELFTGRSPAEAPDASSATSLEESATGTRPPTASSSPGSVRPATSSPAPTAPTDPAAAAASTTLTGSIPPTTTTPSRSVSPAPAAVPAPRLDEGDAMARIEIPTIDLDAVVVAGVDPSDLKKGPGHYPGTPMPGQLGNSAIAGHRTTYGQPFFDLDDVERGDEIVLTTVQGRFVYRATGSEIVPPDAGDVVLTTDPSVARLTLTTCDPKYTATNRLIVYADLDTAASGPGLPPVLDYGDDAASPAAGTLPGEDATGTSAPRLSGPPATLATGSTSPGPGSSLPAELTTPASSATTPASVVPDDDDSSLGAGTATSEGADGDPTAVDAFSHGWFNDTAAWPHVIGWGLVGAAIAVGGYFVARALRRSWAGIAVAAIPFVVVLYFFYQNVNRLLPAAI